jgi:ACS family hexuronate transporter-like MFS transporter
MVEAAPDRPPLRSAAWKWWACTLLLLATMINYMDRLTLNQTAKRVMEEIGFREARYGELESAFAYAFALDAVLFGWMADRWSRPLALSDGPTVEVVAQGVNDHTLKLD